MTGKQRVAKAFRSQPVDRVPWVPFVGCHGASLLGIGAREYLSSGEKIAAGIARAVERYRPDGIPVMFDLQVEAEALGCALAWADENPPAVTSHPLANGALVSDLSVPGPEAGRIGEVLAAARAIRAAHPDLAVYGLLTGPFTLAMHLSGTDLFVKMYDDPPAVVRLLAFCRDVATAMAQYHIEAGCDVIAVVDPMTSQIGPEQFTQFVTPAVAPVFEQVRRIGALSSFFVCGHAQQNVGAMCDCRPDNISIDENIPLQFAREVCTARGVSFGGNLQLTSVLLLGGPADAARNAATCLEVGGETGFVLAPGCDLPYATPPENLEAVGRVAADPYEREAALLTAQDVVEDRLDMRDYGRLDRVVVDVITLDSEACAPCQYMVDAVRRVTPEFEGIVEWREHKIKYRESLVFMNSLMVRNVPTICIDGRITFVSRIPPRDELIAAIQRRINEKFRARMCERQATFYILGSDGDELDEIRAVIARAQEELGVKVNTRVVSDGETIASYGLMPSQTPAVVIGRYQLKSIRHTPDVAAVKEWIKDVL